MTIKFALNMKKNNRFVSKIENSVAEICPFLDSKAK